jgi:O-antigen/teichoic acid export membrane protein
MSASMHRRRTLMNGAFGIAEYVSQPLGLLLAAPYLLHHMGAAQFGIWVLASAAVNSGNILSSGFGDAAVKYVSMYRGRGDLPGVARVVRGMLSINLVLSGLLAAALWVVSPYAAEHVAYLDAGLRAACTESFRIGSLLLVVRSLDGVFANAMRAFERYSPPVRISVSFRTGTLVAAVVLVARGFGVVEIMLATLGMAACAAVAQGIALRAVVGRFALTPSLHRKTLTMIAGFGAFSWLQALSAAVLGQADRLVIGLFLGAPAVACYGLCAQAAQTIHGIVAAGFHVLFPHLSSRMEAEPLGDLRHTVWQALRTNMLLAIALAVPMVLLSRAILTAWMGAEFARQAWPVLSILAFGFALFAMNVTAHYTLLALGRVRLVTALNLVAGAAMLLLMLVLTPRFGLVGTACARLVAGPITCALYLPLYRALWGGAARRVDAAALAIGEAG